MRWSFRDLTHNRQLTAAVLKQLPGNMLGPIHVVRLLDETYPEAFDVGTTVVAKAEASAAPRQVGRGAGSVWVCTNIELRPHTSEIGTGFHIWGGGAGILSPPPPPPPPPNFQGILSTLISNLFGSPKAVINNFRACKFSIFSGVHTPTHS